MTANFTSKKTCTMSGLSRIFAVVSICCLASTSAVAQTIDIGNASAQASNNSDSYTIGAPTQDLYVLSDPGESTEGRGYGFWARIGHIAGQTIGREESITHVELSPYIFTPNDGVIFGSARFFRTNRGDLGGNGGVGFRHYFENYDRIFGFVAWYDRDDTLDEIFEQVTFSLESLGQWFDWRMNVYIPFGDTQQDLGTNVISGSERFVGNNIVFDLNRQVGAALQGFDMEFGTPINNKFARRFDMRLHAGFYWFENDAVDNVAGWMARLEAHPFPTIAMNLKITDDDNFGTNVQFGVDWTFDPNGSRGTSRRKSTYDRMTIPVRRLYNVVVKQETRLDADILAINPVTGAPFIIRHVNSAAAGPGDGSITDPFTTIQDAQFNTAYDIIYAHAESVFAGPLATIVTDDNRRILGEGDGVVYTLPVAGVGTITLPRATTGIALPELLNAPGTAVTLTNGAEFSGFTITSPGGDGLVATGINVGAFNFLNINDAAGRGVALTSNTGVIASEGVNITNAAGNAFEVTGGSASITFLDGSITNSSNRAVSITGITDGFVNMTGTTINDNGGTGIEVLNTAGSVTIDSATILNSTTTGIDVQNTSGLVTFLNTTTINGPAGIAYNVQNTNPGSFVNAFDMNISNLVTTGINIDNAAGSVNNFGTTDISNFLVGAAGGTYAIDFQNSSGNVSFNGININSGGGTPFGNGIRIGNLATNNTGTFTVTGPVDIGTLFGQNIFIEDDDSTVIFENIVNIAGFFEEGVVVQDNRGSVRFEGITTIGGGGDAGVDLQRNSGTTFFNGLTVNNNFPPTAALNAIDNGGDIIINSVNLNSNIGGDGIFGLNNSQLTINAGTIDITGGTAVDIENTNMNINLTSVTANGDDIGIRLVNDTGTFAAGGGIIDTMTIAGLITDELDVNDTNILEVVLNGVTFDQNQVAISTTNLDSLTLDTVTVTNSVSFGVDALNTRLITVTDSTFTNNAADTESVVRSRVDDVLDNSVPYQWIFNDDLATAIVQTFTEDDSDFFSFSVLPGGAGSILEFTFDSNNIIGSGGDQTVLFTDWEGQLTGTYINNTMTLVDALDAGGELIGLDIFNNTTTDLTTLRVQNNLFEFSSTDGDDIGIRLNIDGPSDIDIVDNGINLRTGPFGTGMTFNLASRADVVIDSNALFIDNESGDGVVFQFVNGPSVFTFDNNLIEVVDSVFGGVQERGVIFTSVTGTIDLISNSDNIVGFSGPGVDGGEQFFFIPAGTSNGSFLINGFNVP